MAKEIPILFSTPMVKAILEGRKTQTRRIVKFKKEIKAAWVGFSAFTPDGKFSVRGIHEDGKYGESFFRAPYGKPGDLLWVRETWAVTGGTTKMFVYKTDPDIEDIVDRWRPSIHMPKAAARIWLQVESVGVERLQDISEADAIAEGMPPSRSTDASKGLHHMPSSKHLFSELWQSINGPESWEQNPFVWVVKFKRIKP